MAQEWYYAQGGRKVGPVSEAELRQAAATGKLSADDLVWREGMPQWRAASNVEGLVLKSARGGPPPVPGRSSGDALQAAGGTVDQLADRVGFLDLKFEQFATPHLIGVVFTLALIVLSLSFLSWVVYVLFYVETTAIKAILSIVLALIVYGFSAVCLRVFLELCVVVFRIAEHLSHLRHLSNDRRAE
jgi:hypothetical protein